ncbi:uncharacterized protein LOC106079236 isoform X2 [Biomphalaria glabrata]|uniref:Uncharacterized protein LOC106079236 isoform X2 n=1 Tax=Biomphalaria glabrata TaxID=6526 RepID=A0A2C9M1R2_BIOGL|nr:uncharacterized protein LOC106079236 isoform X2 [Biomphalaria glabrata]
MKKRFHKCLIMYRSVPPCPTPDIADHWNQRFKVRDQGLKAESSKSRQTTRAKVVELGSCLSGRPHRSTLRKFPMSPIRMSNDHYHKVIKVASCDFTGKSTNREKISPSDVHRGQAQFNSQTRISNANKHNSKSATNGLNRLTSSPTSVSAYEKHLNAQKVYQDRIDEKLYRLYAFPDVIQPTDHIHNPEILTDTDTNDLTLLPKPQRVTVRSLKELPWVFRYKVKRANSTLAKIMASKPIPIPVDSRH